MLSQRPTFFNALATYDKGGLLIRASFERCCQYAPDNSAILDCAAGIFREWARVPQTPRLQERLDKDQRARGSSSGMRHGEHNPRSRRPFPGQFDTGLLKINTAALVRHFDVQHTNRPLWPLWVRSQPCSWTFVSETLQECPLRDGIRSLRQSQDGRENERAFWSAGPLRLMTIYLMRPLDTCSAGGEHLASRSGLQRP